MLNKSTTIGFIGAGRMATALAGGIVANRLVAADQIVASDPDPDARERFQTAVSGAVVTDDNGRVAGGGDLIVIAVKPNLVSDALASIREVVGKDVLILSIAAGVRLDAITSQLRPGVRTIRAMPNTPCLVGRGATAISLGPHAVAADVEAARQIFSAVGVVHVVDEKMLDAVTGLSGSGPAFVYTMIEALSDGGVLAGLPRELANDLAAQTVRGAAEMILQTGEHPAILRDRVTSPGGTTAAGLAALERASVRAGIVAAVEHATRRSHELGDEQERS